MSVRTSPHTEGLWKQGPAVKVYIDKADWWIGYYRGPNHHYVCVLPTVVIRWPRKPPLSDRNGNIDGA